MSALPQYSGSLQGLQAAHECVVDSARDAELCPPALAAADALGLPHRVIQHGPVRSLAEAARARGVAPADAVKTLAVRRGEDDFLFVLVPGDRAISWPKLRRLLGVSRLSACPPVRLPPDVPGDSFADTIL